MKRVLSRLQHFERVITTSGPLCTHVITSHVSRCDLQSMSEEGTIYASSMVNCIHRADIKDLHGDFQVVLNIFF